MKIRSQALLVYLLENKIDFQDATSLAEAKREYTRLYKRTWKLKTKKIKEVRPTFDCVQYSELEKRASLYGFTSVTTYARELLLSSFQNRELVPNKEDLYLVLQFISRAQNTLIQESDIYEVKKLLDQAEVLLIQYLKRSA